MDISFYHQTISLNSYSNPISFLKQQDPHQPSGLTSAQAATLLQQQDPNALPEAPPPQFILLFLKQFKSPFIYVLFIAAIISLALSQYLNGVFILAVLATELNAMVPQMASRALNLNNFQQSSCF